MKIRFLCLGKESEHKVKSETEEYTRRIKFYYAAEWNCLPGIKNSSRLPEKELKAKEASLILENIRKDDYLIALDERGTMLSSAKLASWMQSRANESVKQLVFLIGGAYGLDESVLKRANFTWSLSPLTFPHQLVRLILAEQVYRACTILKNEKYHHG